MTKTVLAILALLALMVSRGASPAQIAPVYRACVAACAGSLSCQAACSSAAGK